jgi:hypothetical protein
MAIQSEKDLWELIDRVQATLHLSDETMADLVQASRRQFREMRTKRKGPSATGFTQFADHVGVGMERLLQGDVDFVALAQRFGGNLSYLPERYSVGGGCGQSTSMDLLH